MNHSQLKIALLGGNGARSGVPRHIQHICENFGQSAKVTVFSDVNEGGYDFVQGPQLNHIEVPNLSTSINPIKYLRTWETFKNALKTHGPFDIIWAHARFCRPMSRRYVRQHAPASRLIVTYHGSPFAGRSAAMVTVMRHVERREISTALPHDIVFLSDADENDFADLPLGRHRISIVPNCSDLRPHKDPVESANPTLVMTTRVSRQKNLKAAAQIFSHLPDNYRLILRGTGTDTRAKDLFSKMIDADTCARIDFGGAVNNVRPALQQSDCYLLTSRYEGQSIGALEAFEAGLPVVMPAIGGSSELEKQHPYFRIIDPNKPEHAAKIIDDIVKRHRSDPKKRILETRAEWARYYHHTIWKENIDSLLKMSPVRHDGF